LLRALLSAFALAALLAGCKVYDPSLVMGGADGGVDAGPTGCGYRPPPRPTAPDDGLDVGEIAFAIKDVLFEQGDMWSRIGFDLDGYCTTSPEYETDCVPPDMTVMPVLDGENGIDNVFGQSLYPLVAVTVPGLQEASRRFQSQGNGSVILRIRGWNGMADDARVDVVGAVTVFGTTAAATPMVTIGADGPEMPDGSFPPFPTWDGTDSFWGRDDNFVGGNEDQPYVRDDNAYVRNRFLVVTLPERTDFVFPGDAAGVLVRLTGAVAMGRISEDMTTIEDMTVAGRWAVNDLLETAQAVGVCPGTPQLDIFMNQIDRIADVRSRVGSGGPGVLCDAISVAMVFQGYRANWGGVAPGPPLTNACDMM
jgi:hypothetical protein